MSLISFLRCSFGIHLWVIWILQKKNNTTANLVNQAQVLLSGSMLASHLTITRSHSYCKTDFSDIRELKYARFWDADGDRKWAIFTFNLPSHNHILSIFSPLGMSSIKIWVTIGSQHAQCSLPVAIRVSEMRVLDLPINRHRVERVFRHFLFTAFRLLYIPSSYGFLQKWREPLENILNPGPAAHVSLAMQVLRDWYSSSRF